MKPTNRVVEAVDQPESYYRPSKQDGLQPSSQADLQRVCSSEPAVDMGEGAIGAINGRLWKEATLRLWKEMVF